MKRRTLVAGLVQLTGAAIAGIIAVPGALTLLSPAVAERGPRWRRVGRLDDFPIGTVTQGIVHLERDDAEEGRGARGRTGTAMQEQGVYVWRTSESELVVYSRSCTDLGCPVTWDPGSEWFYCPCHGGIFDREGERRAGPPNRPLFRYAWRVIDGILEVDLHSVPPMV